MEQSNDAESFLLRLLQQSNWEGDFGRVTGNSEAMGWDGLPTAGQEAG